jgi:hypothetical protein
MPACKRGSSGIPRTQVGLRGTTKTHQLLVSPTNDRRIPTTLRPWRSASSSSSPLSQRCSCSAVNTA